MGGREHFLPLYRRWATFRAKTSKTYIGNSRRRFYYITSIEKQIGTPPTPSPTPSPTPAPMSVPAEARLISGGHRRYYNSYDDDEGQDVREQKSAFLRALEGSKGRNCNVEGRRNKPSNENPTKPTRQISNHKNNSKRNVNPRIRNNRNDSRTTISATSKKLTLDEFFANLEKTNTNESSSKPATRRRSRARTSSKGGQREKRLLHPQYDNCNRKSSMTSRKAPVADMGSFFDEVNALMERKENEKLKKTTTKMFKKNYINSPASTSNIRTSLSGIIPPSLSTTNTFSKNDGMKFRREDRDSLHYNCSVESWDQYIELIDEVLEGPKFLTRFHSKKKKNVIKDDAEKTRQIGQIVEWLRSEMHLVESHLPALSFALTGEISDKNDELENDIKDNGDKDGIITTTEVIYTSRSKLFREELNTQKERFVNETCWTKKQYDVATGALVALGSLCAKKCTAPPLDVAWSKLKELGYPMNNKDVLHNYLYVSSTFSLPKRNSYIANNNTGNLGIFGGERIDDDGRGDDGASPSVLDFFNETTHLSSIVSGDDDAGDEIDVSAEVALCHDFLHEATEQSTGIHVRRLVRLGKANEAERLLDATTKSDDLRLRTYAPIYQTYLDQGDVSSAFKLFVKMKESENVILQTETFVQLIACIAENGYFRMKSEEIDGIEELPYSTKCGPDLFNILISELAEHSIEITSASAKRLYNAFQRGFRGDDPKMNLKQLHLLESLQPNNELAEPEELIVSRVRLDESTGKCSRSGAQLRLINLDSIQKRRFQEALLHLVSSSYQERHRNVTKIDVAEKLHRFGEWLQTRHGKPFTAIIDGPNIAYYMQNFQQGTFNFHQIKFLVDALENMGETVLVVLPKKYTYDRFSIQKATQTVKQTLSQKEKVIRDDLIAKGKAYVVPVGSLDDYYWMYASVSMDEEFVPPDNPEGRWPGNRPMLISNDKLRDHKMSLLEPRLFRRWYSNFLVNFTFSAFVNDECIDKEIGFKTADFYSQEIQGNSTNGNGTIWHFPVRDWDKNESLCIRITD